MNSSPALSRRLGRLQIAPRSARRYHTPRIAWELSVLFVLLLVVFAPNLVRMLGVIAPLIPAPQAAFVYPLQIGSFSYNLTMIAGLAGFELMDSDSYSLGMLTGGLSGEMSSANYVMQLGVAGIVIGPAPAAAINWSDNTTVPVSPITYNASQDYTFVISWSGNPSVVRFFHLNPVSYAGAIRYVTEIYENEIEKTADFYTMKFPGLQAGDHYYYWIADSKCAPACLGEGDLWLYRINQATTSIDLSLDGKKEARAVSKGAVVELKANVSYPNVLAALKINLTGSLTILNKSAGATLYSLNTSEISSGVYRIVATTDGNENWTANSTELLLTVADVSISNVSASPGSGAAYNPSRTYNLTATCSGFVSDVVFEWDGVNRSASRIGDTCNATISDTGEIVAGVHKYRWWVNDTAGKWYSIDKQNYEIAKANAGLALAINDFPTSIVIGELGSQAFITAGIDVSGKQIRLVVTDSTNAVREDVLFPTAIFNYPITLDKKGQWNVTLKFAGDTNYHSANLARWIAVNMTDEAAPQPANVGQGTAPAYGGVIVVGADWSDDVLLDYVWLETNATTSGTWQNMSYTYIGGPAGAVNFTINATAPPGTTFGWRIWARDLDGKLNSTDTMSFTIAADVIVPIVTAQMQNESIGPADDMIGVGDSIELSALCNDETLLKEALLATNESGVWDNISSVGILNEMAANIKFNWRNYEIAAFALSGTQIFMGSLRTKSSAITTVSVGAEIMIGWKIYCIDFSGNIAETPVMEFKVKAFDEADVNKNGKIDIEELTVMNGAIAKWRRGEYTLTNLMRLIASWKAGRY
jgi:hypothetical protein